MMALSVVARSRLGLGGQPGELGVGDRRRLPCLDLSDGGGVRQRLVDRLVVQPGGRHTIEDVPCVVVYFEAAVFPTHLLQAVRDERRRAVGQTPRLPARPGRVEADHRAGQRQHVKLKPVDEGLLRLRQLLHDVVQHGLAALDAKVRLQPVIGDGLDARRPHAAQVDGDAIRFLVAQRGQDAFTGGHRVCLR